MQRICIKDGVPLINIVRRAEQVALLRAAGASYVLNSEYPNFMPQLIDALTETNATIAFDAVGGGTLAGAILTAMEQAQMRRTTGAGVYGSAVRKRVYTYGRLDLSPTVLPPTMGMSWAIEGFLLSHFLAKEPRGAADRLTERVLSELTTTFATQFTDEVGLEAMLDPAVLTRANAKATGTKFLILPQV